MDLELAGKVALVTGSSRGIGRAVATLLAREGTAVALTYHEASDEGEAIAAALRTGGADARLFHLDLASDESIGAAIEARWRDGAGSTSW
jgi:3-oxoacyl-[acyl-carrier protein] reductase